MDRGPWWAIVRSVAKELDTTLATKQQSQFSFTFYKFPSLYLAKNENVKAKISVYMGIQDCSRSSGTHVTVDNFVFSDMQLAPEDPTFQPLAGKGCSMSVLHIPPGPEVGELLSLLPIAVLNHFSTLPSKLQFLEF